MRDSSHLSRAHSFPLNWLSRRLFSKSLLLFLLSHGVDSQQFLNLSIPITSPRIVYTPFVCNSTVLQANPQLCSGAWRLSTDNASITTSGPSLNSSNIIPQLFFQFQASDLILTTLPSSNATVNITASSNGTTVSSLFNSTLGLATIINLPDVVSQLTITFVPSNGPTSFDLKGFTITTPQNGTISSILPTPTLPPSISLPPFTTPTSASSTFSTPTTTTPTSTGSHNGKRIAEAVGLTVGISIGLTLLAWGAFYCWKRKRQREGSVSIRNNHSDWMRTGPSR